MMQFKKYIKHEAAAQLDIAPMIDLVFTLLVFFMLISQFVAPTSITIDLPTAKSTAAQTVRKAEISLTADGDMYVNGEQMTLAEIAARFSDADASPESIYIRSDKATSFGAVVAVWDLCKRSGIAQIDIAVRRGA